jgi:hypothetical protein
MRELLARIIADRQQAVGVTLVVGAGNGAELVALRGLGAHRLVLVEPHPQSANELSARIRVAEGEEVWPLAIVPESAPQGLLYVLSNLRYSSLRKPERLLELGPNLRESEPIEVSVCSLAEAIERLSLSADADNLLVLDAPGLSAELIEQTEASLIQRFAWIIVHASSLAARYQGEPSHERATELLSARGFVSLDEDPDALYPEVVTLYRRDDQRLQALQEERLVDRLNAELAEARDFASWRAQQAQRLQSEIEDLRATQRELTGQLQEVSEQRDQQAARAAAAERRAEDLSNELASLLLAKQAQVELVQAKSRQLAEVSEALERLRDESRRLQAEQRQLEASHEEQSQRGSSELMMSLDQAEQRILAQQQKIDQLEYELSESSSRQRLLDEELIKAEAQLELVKDLLLRERTL